MQRRGGFRRKSRHKLKKKKSEKGKLSIRKFTQSFKLGDKVLLKAEPIYQKAMYFPRFHGKTGTVQKKQGNCYIIKIKDQNKEKLLTIHPIHLTKR